MKHPSFLKTLFLLLAMLSLLSGCSDLAIPILEKPVTLRFLYLAESADYKPLAQEFHRLHPNITVELVPIAWDADTYDNFEAGIKDADVLRAPMNWLNDDAVKLLLSLDEKVAAEGGFPKEDLFPGSLEALQLDGKQLGIPAGLDMIVVYYIPQKFADARIQPPGPDWKLTDFVQAAAAVDNRKDADAFTYGFCSNGQAVNESAIFAYLFGGGLFDDDLLPTAPTLNRKENADALVWYTSLNTDFHLMPDVYSNYMLAHKVGSQYCGFWLDTLSRRNYGGETTYGMGSGKYPVAYLPLPKHIAPYPVVQVDSYSIVAQSNHTQAAWQWLMFLIEKPAAAGRLIPPLKTQVFAEGNPDQLSADMLAVAERLPSRMALLPMGVLRRKGFIEAYGHFFTAAANVFTGEASAQAALDQAQDVALQDFQK